MAAATATLALGFAAPANADDYMTLNAAELEQTVLRAQMPKTLGSWTQNYYFTTKDAASTRPTVCWNDKGDVMLPAAQVLGGVAYAVDPNTSGTVSIFQYASEAKAKAALAALKKVRCADYPKVVTDEGKTVDAMSGGDWTDDSLSGYVSILYYDQNGTTLVTDVNTTLRGRAVVQTIVFDTYPTGTADAKAMKISDRASTMNEKWHKNVVRAYENFGQGTSR